MAARSARPRRAVKSQSRFAARRKQTRAARNPLSLRVKLSHQGVVHEIGLVPDLVFGLQFADGSRHSFMVEIDRGTMPIARSDFLQTSFERKMRAYLTAHAGKQHEKHFGWKTFRVLTVTTDRHRTQSMMEALRQLHVPNSIGAPLFLFAMASYRGTIPLASHDILKEKKTGSSRNLLSSLPCSLLMNSSAK